MGLFAGVGFDAANDNDKGQQTSDSSAGSAKVLGRRLLKYSNGKQGNMENFHDFENRTWDLILQNEGEWHFLAAELVNVVVSSSKLMSDPKDFWLW